MPVHPLSTRPKAPAAAAQRWTARVRAWPPAPCKTLAQGRQTLSGAPLDKGRGGEKIPANN
jgi:hypothetical protein